MKSICRPLVWGTVILVLAAASLCAGTTSFGKISTWGGCYSVNYSGNPGRAIYGLIIVAHGRKIQSFPYSMSRVPALDVYAQSEWFEWQGSIEKLEGESRGESRFELSSTAISETGSFEEELFNAARLGQKAGDRLAALPAGSDPAVLAETLSQGYWSRGSQAQPGGEGGLVDSSCKSCSARGQMTSKPPATIPAIGAAVWKHGVDRTGDISEEAHRAWLGAGLVGLGLVGRLRRT